MSNENIARAIVYAARQAQLINQYGMTWEEIEVNTANILAGCSVPADGKMNCAEAVAAHFSETTTRVDRVKHSNLRRIKRERDEARNEVAQLRRESKVDIANRYNLFLEAVELQRQRDEAHAERDAHVRWRKAAEAKLAKLRSYLEDVVKHPIFGDVNSIKHILEETK